MAGRRSGTSTCATGQDLRKLLDRDEDFVLSARELRMARNVLLADTNGKMTGRVGPNNNTITHRVVFAECS